jgi:DNA/RNA endonuclease G (NUC1)
VWFETVEEYADYARSVVAAERGEVRLARRAVVFAPENPDDGATALSARDLAAPLAAGMPTNLAAGTPPWTVEMVRGAAQATKARLGSLLGGAETPALLFTASHGMGFPLGDRRQLGHQGALLCQDWPGPNAWDREIPTDYYFAADDVPADARLLGLIGFHFACYGAGTPSHDDFPGNPLRPADRIADRPFVAHLPRRLLGHPKGGALAIVGHVERAWGYSIAWPDAGPQIQGFTTALRLLMEGAPVGWAVEAINQRYADISSALSAELDKARRFGLQLDPFDVARRWTANNDARSYAVIGDPAVRLPLTDRSAPARPALPAAAKAPGPPPAAGRAGKEATTSRPNEENTMSVQPTTDSAAVALAAGAVTVQVPLTVTIQLGGTTATVAAGPGPAFGQEVPAFGTGPAISIDPDYGHREGYDDEFLGPGPQRVALPVLSAAQRAAAVRVQGADPGADPFELKYHHFSVVVHAARRLAIFTAVNIDGRSHRQDDLTRGNDQWFFDPRVPRTAQVGNELYVDNRFDRGHLVRRLDPAWGRTIRVAKTANDDTFHFTNCSPQHERFNQGKNLWAGLEDYLLDKAAGERKRMIVFTGPVLRPDDPPYRGVRIPKEFWKVAVVARPNGRLGALGFVVSQEALIRDEVSFDVTAVARMFQTSITHVERLTGLDFGPLRQLPAGRVESFAPGQQPLRALNDYEDIQLEV